MDLKDIKAIIDLMKKNSITEFELEEKDSKLRLKRGLGSGSPAAQSDESMPMLPVSAPAALASAISQAATPTVISAVTVVPTGEIDIKSPMIGTFYRSPSPESGSYVDSGSEVTSESVVCIIEAMKVMNEIKSEVKGIITQVLVENGKPVEFGQPLFRVRPL